MSAKFFKYFLQFKRYLQKLKSTNYGGGPAVAKILQYNNDM